VLHEKAGYSVSRGPHAFNYKVGHACKQWQLPLPSLPSFPFTPPTHQPLPSTATTAPSFQKLLIQLYNHWKGHSSFCQSKDDDPSCPGLLLSLCCKCCRCVAVLFVATWGCALAADPNAAAVRSTQQTADCQLFVQGSSSSIVAAGMRCQGGPGTAVALGDGLTTFQSNFTGISHSSRCSTGGRRYKCLITVCSGALVLRNSSISGVALPLDAVLCVAGSSRLVARTSMFVGNAASALACMDHGQLVLHGTSVSDNNVTHQTALPQRIGGGIYVGDRATLTITGGSKVYNNSAVLGGGVYSGNSTTVTISGGSSVFNNRAVLGGGVFAGDTSRVFLVRSTVHSNFANVFGGGVLVCNKSRLVITDASSVHSNTAGQRGGGINAWDDSNVTVTGNSSVHSNVAHTSNGGGFLVSDFATVIVTGSSSVHNNTATASGGIGARRNATVVISGFSRVHHNPAVSASGGGINLWYNASLIITGGSSVHNNVARNGCGGGIAFTGNGSVVIDGNSQVVQNTCKGGVGGGLSVGVGLHQKAFGGKGKPTSKEDSAESHGSVTIRNSTIRNNTSIMSGGGGLAVASRASVMLASGTQVVGNAAVNSSGGAVLVMDSATFVVAADDGVVFAQNAVSKGFVGSTIATFGTARLTLPMHGNLTKCSTGVYLGRTPCGAGETLQHNVCICCPAHTFSFTNTSCEVCPQSAKCSQGSLVEPLAGHWHSSARSIQMHRCPLFTEACLEGGLCRQGHTGPLCGACEKPGYGMVSPLKCGKCMQRHIQLGLYLVLTFATMVFIALTVNVTWKGNLRGAQPDDATGMIKVLVQFMQYVVIIGSVSVPWPHQINLQRWFQAASTVFGAASGQSLSLDCWLPQYTEAVRLAFAIQRSLMHFLSPVVVFVGVAVLQCLWWGVQRCVMRGGCCIRSAPRRLSRTQDFHVARMLPVTALVVMFFAYPTLLRASLGFFACLRIDRGLAAHTCSLEMHCHSTIRWATT